jgi:UDP-N-acetylmuramoylalanine--D-glutamate ligase
MKIAIVGWGVEGRSAYNYFGPEHSYLIVNEEPRNDFPVESATLKVQFNSATKPVGVTGNAEDLSYLIGVDTCDKIVYTPTSVKNLEKRFDDNREFWRKTTTILHIFFDNVNTNNIIGVTGTKGKGTTSTLITKMLEASGKKVFLGGNIGNSVLDFMNEVKPEDWVVLELSSFQLYRFHYSPHIGVCLMITPEHLDWHMDMKEYVESKSNLFKHQKPGDIAIYFDANKYARELAYYSQGAKIPYYASPGACVREDGMIIISGSTDTEIIHKDQVKLLGEHNLQNICAAVTAVWQVSQDVEVVHKVLSTFAGLEHRLEFARELNGVKYYDDSFGTTPETSVVAMQAFATPKVMILGGSDKGIPFDVMADSIIKNNVRHAITIGDTGPKIAELLRAKGFNNITEGLTDMPSIVNTAKEKTQPGDVVLLSTGSASFDMFKDYKDRGNQFKQAVARLS